MNKILFITSLWVTFLTHTAWSMDAKKVQCDIEPLGLITDHHGILTTEDLERAERGSLPATRFDGNNSYYPYWQCFETKLLRASCSYQKPMDKEGSSLGIDIATKSERHFYVLAHAIAGDVCKQMLEDIKKVKKGERYFCINGTNDATRIIKGIKEYDWSFNRLKTKAGYVHYFLPNP